MCQAAEGLFFFLTSNVRQVSEVALNIAHPGGKGTWHPKTDLSSLSGNLLITPVFPHILAGRIK